MRNIMLFVFVFALSQALHAGPAKRFVDGIVTSVIDVDNVRTDGNTVSTTNSNGDLTFDLNGTGKIILTDLTATTVPYLDANKKITSSSVTPTELGFLSGIGSSVPVTKGGTGLTSVTTGDILYGSGTNAISKLAAGTNGHVLTMSGGIPAWSSATAASLPAGSVIMFGGSSCPSGYLPMDGAAISRTTYSALFTELSTTYGTGDGSTTFNVPNAQGVFIRGAGSQTISSIGYTGTRGTTQGDTYMNHGHRLKDDGGNLLGRNGGGSSSGVTFSNTGSSGSTTWLQGVDQLDVGSGSPRAGSETRPANIVLLYCIKT